MSGWRSPEGDSDQGAQKVLEPSQEQSEVVAGGGEDGVDSVTVAALEVVAFHAVFGLDAANHRLDRGPALYLAANGLGHPACLAGDPDPELVGMAVAAIALNDMDAADFDAGEFVHLGDHRAECVAVIGGCVAMRGLGVERELAALGPGDRGCDADLADELVRRLGLAFAD